jgi:sterol 14-demethylase
MPGGLPLLGHVLAFRRNPVAFLESGRRQFGEAYAIDLPGSRATVLTGPRAHQAFFTAPDDQLSAKEAYQFTVPIFGKGIAYDAPPGVMDEQLGFVVPALRKEGMHRYVGQIQEEVEGYFEGWGDEGEADLLSATQAVTTYVASRCLLGQAFRSRVTEEFIRLYHDLERGLTPISFLFPRLPLPAFRRRDRARARMGGLISEVLAGRKAAGVRPDDFLQVLAEARYASGRPLTDDEVAGLLLTFVFAGHHTSAVLAAWTGILLLQHPPHLRSVLKEQREIYGEGREATFESLGRAVLLERAIQEAERMYPPLFVLMRKALRDFRYGDYVTPAGDLVAVSPAVSHRLPEVFAEPDRYDPDRFAPGREEDQRQPHALIGFGGGKHRCLGYHFAYTQIKVIWGALLRRFELELAGPPPAPDYSTFVAGPRQPCLVRYRRRLRGWVQGGRV